MPEIPALIASGILFWSLRYWQCNPLWPSPTSGPERLAFIPGCFGSRAEPRASWRETGNNFPRCGTKARCWQAVCRVGQTQQSGCGLPDLEEQTHLLLWRSVQLTAGWTKPSHGVPINAATVAASVQTHFFQQTECGSDVRCWDALDLLKRLFFFYVFQYWNKWGFFSIIVNHISGQQSFRTFHVNTQPLD